ncbi:MAG TPA: hypothetical protein VEW03_04210, partial [Longimicrobiaceae bacterium]|nr:hypothetical protein [Longimicrobiaceae bacterium]
MRRAGRFLRTWLRGGANPGVRAEEVEFPLGGGVREATLYRPPGRGPRPGWVVLQGLTVPGRRHPAMTRFARSVAA